VERNLDLTEPLCISVPAAAKMLGVSRNTGYEMARLGQLPTIKCGQRRLVVPKAALLRMLEETPAQASTVVFPSGQSKV